jgi:hypothetical protein
MFCNLAYLASLYNTAGLITPLLYGRRLEANTEREGAGEAERPANRVWKAMVFAYLGLAALFLAGSVGAALIALDKPASRGRQPRHRRASGRISPER